MSFRDRMKVAVSNAEIQLFAGLSRRGLTRYMRTQIAYVFDWELDGVCGTKVDFDCGSGLDYCVFLDEQHIHSKAIQSNRDMLVDKALRKRGKLVERYTYTQPLTHKRETEILNSIGDTLKIVTRPILTTG